MIRLRVRAGGGFKYTEVKEDSSRDWLCQYLMSYRTVRCILSLKHLNSLIGSHSVVQCVGERMHLRITG